MLKIFLWLRYLGKRRVVLLSVAAVALSCALLITVASIFAGFINAFERSATNTLGDVVLSPGGTITDYDELTRKLEGLACVEAATGTLSTQGLLHLGRGNVRAVEIWGIEVQKQEKVTAFKRSLLKGKPEETKTPDGIGLVSGFIGMGLICEPNETTDEYDLNAAEAAIGREAVITTGSFVEGTDGESKFKRQTIRLVIADVVFTGVYYLDNRSVYVPIASLQKAIYPDSSQPIAGQIQIKLRNSADSENALAQIRGVWKTFAEERLGWGSSDLAWSRVETAKQLQARYVAEFRKQMGILLLIFGVVSLSAVLLVFCIFYMIVESRRRDVAILKSCGATGTTVAMIFVGFGGFIGVTGAAAGTVLGYFVTKNINAIEEWIRVFFGLKLWKASVYIFSRIPNEVDWRAVVWITLAAVSGAAVGALMPAISAALTRPVNVLRYE